MRIGIVFHKDPFAPPSGIDLVRLRAIAGGLIRRGISAEIVSPVEKEGVIEGFIPVRGLDALREKRGYDLVKTCYHYSIELIGDYEGPVVSRIVRVVDEKLPERDEPSRERLLQCQDAIRERSAFLVLNNKENQERWRRLYGEHPPVVLLPTGCPSTIPPTKGNPYDSDERVILFLGSVAAGRMVRVLNDAAERLNGRCAIHVVGRNKADMYGAGEAPLTEPPIVNHGELPQDDVWDYIRHADMGLALATGPHPFDNDVSKILNYLRGGLPVLSEEPILNNELIRRTEFGKIFNLDDPDDLVSKAIELLDDPPLEKRESVMKYMAREQSWDKRVDTYVDLFHSIVGQNG